jgi:hypothetical protein
LTTELTAIRFDLTNSIHAEYHPMLDAVPTLRRFSRSASFQGFAASLLLCSMILSAINPSFLGPVDWLCSDRTETTEPNVEEAAQIVVTLPNSQRRGARQESPRVSAPLHVRAALSRCLRSAGELQPHVFLESIRMRC